jgi:hypothetical protein
VVSNCTFTFILYYAGPDVRVNPPNFSRSRWRNKLGFAKLRAIYIWPGYTEHNNKHVNKKQMNAN